MTKWALLILVLTCLGSIEVQAYLINESGTLKKNFWKYNKINLDVIPGLANVSDSSVMSIVADSANRWNSSSATKIIINQASGEHPLRNTLSFNTSDSEFYSGSGVAAVTRTAYSEITGEIIQSKIYINQNRSWSDVPGSSTYLGDVVSHELGHFLGLGHSQVQDATMLYYLVNGQYSLHEDDKSGINHLYPITRKNKITGKIVGGKELIGVLGAHVQAISNETGKVFAAAYTDENGNFEISGLESDTYYHLYVEPAKALSTISSTYAQARNDFCTGSKGYRGSFFQSCFSSDEGRPQAILTGSSGSLLNAGNISIRCSFDVPVPYMLNKGGGLNELKVLPGNYLGITQTGFFSETEVENSTPDFYSLDLSNLDFSDGTYVLDISTLSQKIYSKFVMKLSGSYGLGSFSKTYSYDADGRPSLDLTKQIYLDSSTAANNIFTFELTPESLSLNPGINESLAFPVSDSFKDDMFIYSLMVRVKKLQSDGSYKVVKLSNKISYFDNSSCPDASNTFKVSSQIAPSSSLSSKKDSKNPGLSAVACGSIDTKGPPSGPMGSLLIGIFLTLLFGVKPPRFSN